jgi:hypothetical protein
MGQVLHGGATTTAAIRLTRAAGALQAAALPSLTSQLAICNTGKSPVPHKARMQPGECWICVPLPPPSSIGPTFSDPHSAPEIPRNRADRRADLLTG